MTAAGLLSVRQLRVEYQIRTGGFLRPRYQALRAVDGVSFELGRGESLGVVGESGCGKTTLARSVLMLKRPASGQVLWFGENVSDLDEESIRPLRRNFQLIFQDPLSSLDPRMTASEAIAEALHSFHPDMSPREMNAAVEKMIRQVGLPPESASRYPHELSGGQCQRVSIARHVILRPELLVLDEPVSALDVAVQVQIAGLLKRLQSRLGMALLFISHDLSVIRHLCERVLVLYLGKVVETGPRSRIFSAPLHPYTRALLSSVPTPDPRRGPVRASLDSSKEQPSSLNPPPGCRFSTRCPFATERCRAEEPPLIDSGTGQEVACHYWEQWR
ncbi:MAG: ATP-binding cassette domain-containing protein [Gammaproteobacteria bacterium]|nr:ATP-binding cassette domain-containing protein [Gammaproteobacteria bacterium]MYF68042.1 ATP-binding cassette domain-containing protein [Gammaproteobacteria bacterium]MYK37676.1 ATP-binding cassette domain-containing protein [Gammaproteobacteria bacterium]